MGSSVSRRPRRRVIRARRTSQVALCLAVTALLILVLAATAFAYVPGQRIWARTVGTAASEAGAWDVATGPNGAVCVGGWKDAASSPDGVGLLVKYNAAGVKKWTRTYKGLGSAEVDAVAVDRWGNLYAAGDTWGSGRSPDIFVAKYTSGGVRKWVRTYSGDGNFGDWPDAVRVDGSGNVYVAGTSFVSDSLEGIVAIKYSSAGTRRWAARLVPDLVDPNQGDREFNEMAIDTSGNVYVAADEVDGTAPAVHSALAVKFATSNGAIVWSKPYTGKDGTGAAAYGIAVRGNSVVVVGEASNWAGDLMNLLVLRYDLAGNEKHPPLEYDRSASSDDWADDVAIDKYGNAYVTGGFLTQPDDYPSSCALVKVSPTGALKWVKAYLPTSKYAEGWYVRVDGYGNAYVAGIVGVDPSDHDKFLTMRYSSAGVRKWVKTWTPAGVGYNEPDGLALGTTGGVYVAGQAEPRGDYYQAVLIKYQR
jgi:hypothetical protein